MPIRYFFPGGPAPRAPVVGGEQGQAVIDLHQRAPQPDIQILADIEVGGGVFRLADHQVAVAPQLGPGPGHRLPGCRRQGAEGGLLPRVKDLDRVFPGGAVGARPRHLHGPPPRVSPHLGQAGERAPREEAVPRIGDIAFDPRLVLGMGDAGRVDDAAVITGQFAIGAIEAGVIAVGLEDAGAEIIGNDALGHTAKEGERLDVPGQPGVAVLGEHGVQEGMAAVGERHQEHVDLALPPGLWVEPAAGVEEVDLRLGARGWVLEADRGLRRAGHAVRPGGARVAVEGAPACPQPLLVPQALIQHGEMDLADVQVQVVAIVRHIARDGAGRALLGDVGEGRGGEPVPRGFIAPPLSWSQTELLGGADVLADRGAGVAERAGDVLAVLAGVPLHQNLLDIRHDHPPACHVAPSFGSREAHSRDAAGPQVANSGDQAGGKFG